MTVHLYREDDLPAVCGTCSEYLESDLTYKLYGDLSVIKDQIHQNYITTIVILYSSNVVFTLYI